jgi:hypothetical protein
LTIQCVFVDVNGQQNCIYSSLVDVPSNQH